MTDLTWTQTDADLWRTACGRYVIVRTSLPETVPHPVFTLRKIDPAMFAAHPDTLGYFVAEQYTLDAAQREANQDAWVDAQGSTLHVPEDFPAEAMNRFFWPISNGTRRAALVVVHEYGRTLARVIGMVRADDGPWPCAYAEIDITELSQLSQPCDKPPTCEDTQSP